jgi:hypothetical protein
MRNERTSGNPNQRRWSRRARSVGLSILLGLGLPCAAWTLLHRVPGAAPALADAARVVLGDTAVAALEDGLYAVEDSVKRRVYAGARPKAHWRVDAASSPSKPSVAVAPARTRPSSEPTPPVPPAFRPRDVGPLYPNQRAEGDGVWLAAEPEPAALNPVSFKTLIHPDPERSYAELFVVALDLASVRLHAVAGSAEPENEAPSARAYSREAVIPPQHRAALLAAFNGGFKSTHGHFGMQVDGVTLAPAKPQACTVAGYPEGELRIGTFAELADPARMLWYRQTPRCMVEAGVRHPALTNSRSWGATLDGKTVIRRSAIGLNPQGTVLFVGISNSTTAEALARGMQHAGAATVAQLDVNYSFPRFLFYAHTNEGVRTLPLAEGFVYTEGQYLKGRSDRDFFYLTRTRVDSVAGAARPSTGPSRLVNTRVAVNRQ